MTATHTFDVFASVEGPVAAGDWTGCGDKQGPELLDHRLRLVDAKQRMVFGPADADVVSGDAVDVVARLKQDSDRAKTGDFADSHPELGWLASKIHRAAAVRDRLDGCPHDASDSGGVRHERGRQRLLQTCR